MCFFLLSVSQESEGPLHPGHSQQQEGNACEGNRTILSTSKVLRKNIPPAEWVSDEGTEGLAAFS